MRLQFHYYYYLIFVAMMACTDLTTGFVIPPSSSAFNVAVTKHETFTKILSSKKHNQNNIKVAPGEEKNDNTGKKGQKQPTSSMKEKKSNAIDPAALMKDGIQVNKEAIQKDLKEAKVKNQEAQVKNESIVATTEIENQEKVDEEESEEEEQEEEQEDEQLTFDKLQMSKAVEMAQSAGGERSPQSAYPNPTAGAVLIAEDGTVLGKGRSDYSFDCIQAAIADAGVEAVPLQEWCVTWPSSSKLRRDLAKATLYTTLEPTMKARGQSLPPITQLIELCGIRRVVIGCADPIPERATKGASTLHMAGIDVSMGKVLLEECESLITGYAEKANGKLQRMARKHFAQFKRPLGFLHASVVNSEAIEAFARHGNAFGKNFGGKNLSFRSLGAYELAPPPEAIWAIDNSGMDEDFDEELPEGDIFSLEFDDEDLQESLGGHPMMPWYEQVDAVVATFPRPGNGPVDDDSLEARLNGLKWLATVGNVLPAGVERILVMDATDLQDLPLTNGHEDLPEGVDVEAFWAGKGRKPTRVLLRRGENAQAQAAALAAAKAAESAAKAANAAKEALETGDAESAAEAAIECQQAAADATAFIQNELMSTQELKRKLTDMGTIVETLSGGEPVDVMNHLGRRNGYESVVWRAGCWGNRGVEAILAGAFQWVSAHLAVDAKGGKFWQLMLAERAIQAACGPESKVKVFAGAEDISLEYCDQPSADSDCVLTIDGRPVRHVRLDCRVALVDPKRPREFVTMKTQRANKKIIEEAAPWFL